MKPSRTETLEREHIERVILSTREVLFDSILMLCRDIAEFNGSAADCVVAITTFQRRLDEKRTIQ
jgi:hypothetical protein